MSLPDRRPSVAASKFPTAPMIMTVNGNSHFANVGDAPTEEQYDHGIQVIDEDKEFKYRYTTAQTTLSPVTNPYFAVLI